MVVRIGTIHAALSSVAAAVETAATREVGGDERISEENLDVFHSPSRVGVVDDSNTNTNADGVNLQFHEKDTPDLELRQEIRTQTLRNPAVFPESMSDSDDRKGASAFDASNELGILDGQQISNQQHVAVGRGLEIICGGDRPVIGADANFKTLVDVCLNSEDLCPYSAELSCWNTSMVTSMSEGFYGQKSFNEDISEWDVSNVKDMSRMFADATNFNQNLESWEVGSVTDMGGMFFRAYDFDQPLDSWQTSFVTSTRVMFSGAVSFNQPIDSWDVSSVQSMAYMFSAAVSFNQPLDSWDTSSVSLMHQMFWQAQSFNQCLSTWADKTGDTLSVSYMLSESGCPYQSDPDPAAGPWCQGSDQQCYGSSSFSEESSTAASLSSVVALGMIIPNIAMLAF